jgi:tRNA splicing ligase
MAPQPSSRPHFTVLVRSIIAIAVVNLFAANQLIWHESINKCTSKSSFSSPRLNSKESFVNNGHSSSHGRSRTLHIMHCLSGNDPDFIDEWEIGFKSILVNAPLDSNLHVHLVADENAATAIDSRIIDSKLV